MTAIEKFTTAHIRQGDRLGYWNRLTDETYAGTSVDQGAHAFEAEMLRWNLGELTVIRPKANASVVARRPTGGGDERIVLHLQHRGRCRQEHVGRTVDMCSGDFSLCTVAAPYRFELTEHEFLVVEMPRPAIEERVRGLDDLLGRRIAGSTPGTRMLHNFFLSLWQQGDLSEADPHWQRDVADVMLDLVGLAVRGAEMSLTGPLAQRERARRLVEANLCDPDFGGTQLAAELGVSIRAVQNLFAAMGTTPNGYILSRRLARASEMLTINPDATVTEIAFELGFSESSYFTRCFRQRFGTTPSKWRVRH
jgi:AraC-like DNA-binding protein